MIRCISLLIAVFLACLPASAQESTEVPEAAILEALVLRAEAAAEQAASSAQEARGAIDLSFNVLGLFEVFGGVISIVAVVGGLIAVQRLRSFQSDLSATRERFEVGLKEAQTRFEQQLEIKERELNALRDEIRRETMEQRTESEHGMLALSLLPLAERQYLAQDLSGALNIYLRSLELDHDNMVVYYRLGYVYTQMGELEKAEEFLMRALKIDGTFVQALAALGYVYRRMGEKLPTTDVERGILLARAEEKLRDALRVSPRLVDEDGESWWGSLGGLHRRRGQIEDAIDAYRRAAEVTPQSSYPFSNLALLYLLKGEYDQMLQHYLQVEKLAFREVMANVDNYWGYADLLTARLALGKPDLAAEALESVFATVPIDAPYFLASLMETLSQLEQVLASHDTTRADSVRSVIERIKAYQNATMTKEQAS